MNYSLKDSLKNSDVDVMYIYGDKEMNVVKKSAYIFKSYVKSCEIYEAKGYNHGYLSVYLPEEWLRISEDFLYHCHL